MKFLVLGDPHGAFPKKALKQEFDAVLCVGDICEDKYYRPLLKKLIRKNISFEEQKPKRELRKLETATINSGKELFKQLAKIKKPVYYVQGNWDITRNKTFEQTYVGTKKLFTNVEKKTAVCKDVIIMGSPYVGIPELLTNKNFEKYYEPKKDLREYNKRYAKLEKRAEKAIQKQKPLIILSHNPPFKILDKVINKGTKAHNVNLGSIALRRIIEQAQPKYCFFGHIHERKGAKRHKKTICVNTGAKTAFILNTSEWTLKEL